MRYRIWATVFARKAWLAEDGRITDQPARAREFRHATVARHAARDLSDDDTTQVGGRPVPEGTIWRAERVETDPSRDTRENARPCRVLRSSGRETAARVTSLAPPSR